MRARNHSSRFIAHFLNASYDKKRLGEVCCVTSGKTIDLALENEGGPIAYLKVADLNLAENDRVVTTSSRYVSEQTALTSGLVPIGATIFPKNGAAALHNKKRITSIITCVDMNTMAVYSKSDTVKPEYLYAFLESQDLATLTLVGAIPQIRAKDVQALMIPVPNVEEQEEYITMMHQADKSKFNGFKSRFIEMFRTTQTVTIGSMFDTTSGGTPSSKQKEYYYGGTIPWLTSGEVAKGKITDTAGHITELGLLHSSAKWVPVNTVVIAMYGATVGKVGLLTIPCTTNQAICSVLPKESVNPLFLYHAIKSKETWMSEQAVGAAQPNISQAVIKKMDIPMPSKNLQDAFVRFAEQADKSKYLS